MSLFDVPEVLLSHEVPSEEVRMVPELPTVTKVPSPYVTPDILLVVLVELTLSEVRMVPDAPTATNNSGELELLDESLFLAQEIRVRLKHKISNINKILFIFFTYR